MASELFVTAAANTLAPAHSELQKSGFTVSLIAKLINGDTWVRAEKPGLTLEAPDVLQLLGLASLVERRGPSWTPTDTEVESFLKLASGA